MNRLHVKFIKWVANIFGYKIAMVKVLNGTTTIEGDNELLRYTDLSGYIFKQEPLSRIKPHKTPTSAQEMFLTEPKPDVSKIPPITKLTPEQLKEVGL
jgi:hypothetical protein